MIKLLTGAQMRDLDRTTSERYGLAGVVLMEHAGTAVARAARALLGDRQRHVCVVCGAGNNGGDGFVAARWLRRWGYVPEVFLLGERSRVGGDARTNLEIWVQSGFEVEELLNADDLVLLTSSLRRCGLVVDALLGTGVSGPPREPMASAIRQINAAGTPVLSVDLPSGVDADTGAAHDPHVRAARTVTFGAWKRGLVLYPGAAAAASVELVDIGIPDVLLHALEGVPLLAEKRDIARRLPPRDPAAHKGQAGRVVVVGGSRGLGGAPLLAGLAALRGGAGLVTLGLPASLAAAVEAGAPEVMSRALPESEEGALSAEAAEPAGQLAAEAGAVALGPGLGTGAGAVEVVRAVVAAAAGTLVADADALNLAARTPGLLDGGPAALVITPHPGEAGRLLGLDTAAVQADRLAAARELSRRYRATAVLKGARTVVAAADGPVVVNPTGTPAMAGAGMGDALTGLIAALAGQGLPAFDAALVGVWLHGRAGELAAGGADAGLLASDLIAQLPAARRELRE